MKEKIKNIMTTYLSKEKIIRLEDTSSKHASHGNFSPESHFEIEVHAEEMPVYQRIQLHKTLTSAFSCLYGPKMVHSISVNIK